MYLLNLNMSIGHVCSTIRKLYAINDAQALFHSIWTYLERAQEL